MPLRCNIARGGFVLVYRKRKREEVWALTNEEFTGLMQQYQKLIYTVCLQFVHEPHTAEDLTQDTFLSAFSAIDRCEPQYYKQWLVRVAANKCKDHLKSAWVRKVDAPGDDALPEPRGVPGSDADDPAQSVIDRAGAAELVARIAVCMFLPQLFAGGAVGVNAPPLAFYALCAADPCAWIAADAVLSISFIRNILRQDYRYMYRHTPHT